MSADVVGWLRPMPGRYQLATDLRGQVTRLDTQTGRLEVFVVDRGGQLEPLDEALARDAALRGDAAARAADAEAAIQARMARMLARKIPSTYFQLIPEWITSGNADHKALLRSIKASDAHAARLLSEEHVRRGGKMLVAYLMEVGCRPGLTTRA